MPHSYLEGSDIFPHVHFVTNSASSGSVAWGLEYTWANVGADFGNTTIVTNFLAIAAATGNRHYVLDVPAAGISGTGKEISSMLVCRIFRAVSDPNDNYPTSIGLMEIDFHFMQCGMGSGEQYQK